MKLATGKNPTGTKNKTKSAQPEETTAESGPVRVRFEVFGEEMLEKEVKLSGNSGRIYLPPDWVGHQVKIIRID